MNEFTPLCERNGRFRESLRSSVGHFRKGEDRSGFDEFLNSLDDLESILDYLQCVGEPEIELEELLAALKELPAYLHGQDVTALTDALEFAVYPLTEKWIGGVTENDDSPKR
ncbi:hypothetical protein [Caproiciproducens sp. CPB-2]|uniref:hypothetical protein n=1 Tax=Caproiciproducens sp. CPB-2 TaxID=3030017 RepID=UPI0023DA012D|nr:hypothetical protein [Caproiciproducens sp. CPB-2]MDF1494777.1 hypothetical protein [Caproiciproducens sp. CPB-2]